MRFVGSCCEAYARPCFVGFSDSNETTKWNQTEIMFYSFGLEISGWDRKVIRREFSEVTAPCGVAAAEIVPEISASTGRQSLDIEDTGFTQTFSLESVSLCNVNSDSLNRGIKLVSGHTPHEVQSGLNWVGSSFVSSHWPCVSDHTEWRIYDKHTVFP